MRQIAILLFLIAGCSPLKMEFNNSEVINDHFVGFALYDPAEGRYLYEFNSEKYFTPASNTKILTMFTAINYLRDSIVGLRYLETEDTLYFWGTGDPSFLNPDVHQTSKVYDFLSSSEKTLAFSDANFHDQYFGPGWGWDDYNDYYSVEKSAFPIYGNYVIIYNDSVSASFDTEPNYFKKFLIVENPDSLKSAVIRDEHNNIIRIYRSDSVELRKIQPFKTSADITIKLLEDTLKRPVTYVYKEQPPNIKSIRSTPVDSLIAPMMIYSDNFIAEQLMLNTSALMSDSLRITIAIDSVQSSLFADLPDKLNWVDGSGLSRYNLFTPRSIVSVWNKLLNSNDLDHLKVLLATGGVNGTIRNLYSSEEAFVWGKTGSLRNNHSLSGFIHTDKGNTLIFSYMNSNYTLSSTEVKNEMDKVLRVVKSKY